MVAAAVEIAGGPTAVARLCGVRRQSVYWWIKEWKVERLVDALKLSRAQEFQWKSSQTRLSDQKRPQRGSDTASEGILRGLVVASELARLRHPRLGHRGKAGGLCDFIVGSRAARSSINCQG